MPARMGKAMASRVWLMAGAAAMAVGQVQAQGNPNAYPPTSNQLTASVVPGASCAGAGMVTIINLSSAVLYNNPTAPAYSLVNASKLTQVVGGLYNNNDPNAVGMSVQDGITADLGLPLAVGPGKPKKSTQVQYNQQTVSYTATYSYPNMFGIPADPTANIDPANALPIAAYPLITTFNAGTTPKSGVQNPTGYQQYMGYSLGTNMFLGIPYCSRNTTLPGWSAKVDQSATQCPRGSVQQTAVWQIGLMNVANPPNNAQYISYTNTVSVFTRVMNAMTFVAGLVGAVFDGGVQFGADIIGAIAGGAGSFQRNTYLTAQTRPAFYGQTYMSLYSSHAADYDGNSLNNAGTQTANGLFTNAATGSEIGGSGISYPFGATPLPNAFAMSYSTEASSMSHGIGQSTTVMLQTMANDSPTSTGGNNDAGQIVTCPSGWLMTIWDTADFNSCVLGADTTNCSLGDLSTQVSRPANAQGWQFNGQSGQ